MTLVSSIITSAFRETNLIPVGQSPTTNQQNEALDRLNTIILSVFGNEVGDSFTDLNIGGQWDQSYYTQTWVPKNVRLVFNLTSAIGPLSLDPSPDAGQRLSFVDAGNNLATYPVTIKGNGRLIEGASQVVLNVNGDSRDWFFRSDTGTWNKVVTLALSDQMPFPQKFDDFFITMLAMRIDPRFSQNIPQEVIKMLERARSQIRSHYHQYKQAQSDLTTWGWLSNPRWRGYWSNPDTFNSGRPYPFL